MMILVKILATIWVLAVSWVVFAAVFNKRLTRPKDWVVRLTVACIIISIIGVIVLLTGAVWLIP